MVPTKLIGDMTEAVVMAEFVKAGFPALIPFGENHRYYLVIEAGGRFLRVQCKTARAIATREGWRWVRG
jgi:PD-(D/E)XK nuclease superfamily protein